MEFLYMSEEIMDTPSFLDSAGSNDLEWNSWTTEEPAAESNQIVTRKRRANEVVSSSSKTYKGSVPTPVKQSRGNNAVSCNQEHINQNGSGWHQVEELTNNLSDELDGSCSLTNLGVDLNSSSYNISDALLALPLNFKQELPSPGNNHENGGLFGSNQLSPDSVGSVSNSPQSSSHIGPLGGSSSVSNSPPHLLQMATSNCYESSGEQKQKGPIPVCLVVPENHQSPLLITSNQSSNATIENCNQNECNSARNGSNVLSNNKMPNGKSLVGLTCPQTSAPSVCQSAQQPVPVAVVAVVQQHSPASEHSNEDCRFQYVLAAATSIATKVNEETQTYLNQGQSYEIKLKKLGDLSHYRGKILKSVVRLSFHERRLQYMEGEQMAAWVAAHPSLKILEVDLPLSYGIVDVLQDRSLNSVEFLWDPTKEVGVYIKVNCISTEFTPNKHGGEKGVPFRIQVETFLQGQNGTHRILHTASCQVKVFKLKGADRKHKQDREKILKRPPCEQDKYQPSYECTVLNDMPVNSDVTTTLSTNVSSSLGSPNSDKLNNVQTQQPLLQQPAQSLTTSNVTNVPTSTSSVPTIEQPAPVVLPPIVSNKIVLPPPGSEFNFCESALGSSATVQQAAAWLQANRFSSFARTFANFSGLDLLRLSCDNLVQICGLPEGIRLYNALHKTSRLTLYLCVEANPDVYHAAYLAALTNQELKMKLASLLGLGSPQIDELFLRGPNGIHIIISDDVVRNFKDESTFVIELLQGHAVDSYSLLLKPSLNHLHISNK